MSCINKISCASVPVRLSIFRRFVRSADSFLTLRGCFSFLRSHRHHHHLISLSTHRIRVERFRLSDKYGISLRGRWTSDSLFVLNSLLNMHTCLSFVSFDVLDRLASCVSALHSLSCVFFHVPDQRRFCTESIFGTFECECVSPWESSETCYRSSTLCDCQDSSNKCSTPSRVDSFPFSSTQRVPYLRFGYQPTN